MGTVKRKEACESCIKHGGDTSQDNRVVYDDDSYYCFACGDFGNTKPMKNQSLLKDGEFEDLKDRGLSKQTCEKYNISQAKFRDELVHIFPVFNKNEQVKQKIRNVNEKKFTQVGDTANNNLFGQHLFNPSENIHIVVTEGEFDAAAVHQSTQFPAVSVFRGAGGALKEVQANFEWLNSWKHVVFCFDSDEPGRKAASECAELFEPGKARIASLPLKDANEMLLAGRTEELKKCIWNASITKPDTIVFPDEIKLEAMEKPKLGISWPWPTLTKVTYGYRQGELYHVFGGTGTGKTEYTEEIIQWLIAQNIHCGIFTIEQRPADRLRRMVSKRLNKRLYLPGTDWGDMALVEKEIDYLSDKVAFYDPGSGSLSIDKIMINMRYLNKTYKTQFFVLDNLKALSTNPVIDGKHVSDFIYMSHVVSKMFLLSRELNVTILLINHVRKNDISVSAKVSSYDDYSGWNPAEAINAEGLTWETGRVPNVGDIYGGGNINDLVDFTIALSRNTVSPDPLTKRTMYAKVLKSRLDSRYTGTVFKLLYDYETGRLLEEINNG